MDKDKMIDAIAGMTVLELSELVKAIEEKFDVSAAAMLMMAGATSSAGAESDETEKKEEKTSFSLELTSAGAQKIQVIKALREMTALGLKEAKDLVDAAPKMVKEGVAKEEAEEMKKKLEAAGAIVTIR